ncbi:MAG: hypothetical protein ACOCYG_03845 [Spirochaetota bacterium]
MLRLGSALAVAAVVLVAGLTAQERPSLPQGDEDDPDLYYDVEKYGDDWVLGDRNNDGSVDYAVYLDEDLLKTREVMDFNNDGLMDDFYFYENEVLVRQELDTNYDGAVDLWIHMHEGVYVRKWVRDTDYDGIPDVTKDYGEEE